MSNILIKLFDLLFEYDEGKEEDYYNQAIYENYDEKTKCYTAIVHSVPDLRNTICTLIMTLVT
jgi:hypothetical protein